MMTLSLKSPKSMLAGLADVFQVRNIENNRTETRVRTLTPSKGGQVKSEKSDIQKSKLNISLDDLKTISTALLHYRRSLSKMGEKDRAEKVAGIDKQFYDIILQLEAQEKTLTQNIAA